MLRSRLTALLVPALLAAAALGSSPASAEGAPYVKSCKRDTRACIEEKCDGLRGKEKRACKETCRGAHGCTFPPIGTLAYVVTECQVLADGRFTARQSLRIRRGNCDPVMLSYCVAGENVGGLCMRDADCRGGICGDFIEPVAKPLSSLACQVAGKVRYGSASKVAGVFQRLGVSPDGSTVLVEVADLAHPDFRVGERIIEIAAERDTFGIYRVRANGSELTKIGPPGRAGVWDQFTLQDDTFLVGLYAGYRGFSFSPDGGTVVLTDLGPSEEGEDAFQVVTLDVASGRRRVLTRLPPAPSQFLDGRPRPGPTPRFIGDERILFFTLARTDGGQPSIDDATPFTARTDGPVCTLRTERTRCKRVPTPDLGPVGRLAPLLSILGGSRNILTVRLGEPRIERPFANRVSEVFFNSGENLLQLTNFGRVDTDAQSMAPNGRRAFLTASANLKGRNPTGSCQLFSADIISGRIRQLTRFQPLQEGRKSENGCIPDPGSTECHVTQVLQDPATGTLLFASSCDPFGTNPNGQQIFAIRTDGAALRQLTHTRGVVEPGDRSLTVELPGPYVYSTPWQVDTF